jgi:hypothetical protein
MVAAESHLAPAHGPALLWHHSEQVAYSQSVAEVSERDGVTFSAA